MSKLSQPEFEGDLLMVKGDYYSGNAAHVEIRTNHFVQ